MRYLVVQRLPITDCVAVPINSIHYCCMCFPLQHNSQLPKNYKEKEAFKSFLREGIQKSSDCNFLSSTGTCSLLITVRCFRYSKERERCSGGWRKLWRSHSPCQHRSEPHQGVQSQTLFTPLLDPNSRIGFYSLMVEPFSISDPYCGERPLQ